MTGLHAGADAPHLVGVLGGRRGAAVDGRGAIRPDRALWTLEWWIGADDRWHVPTHEAAVRQVLVDQMPVVRTSMRVPGGDAVHEVFGATPDTVVVDVENASAAPFVAGIVVRGASTVALHDTVLEVDGIPAVAALRPPSRWASSTDGALEAIVTGGAAHDGAMPAVRDRAARVDVALLYPVAHRTRLRVAVALGRRDSPGLAGIDITRIPGADDVAHGWRAQLERGMRVELPDAALNDAVDAARAQLLLAAQAWRTDPSVFAALEDWGFDDEAVGAWARLGFADRRRARRRRSGPPASWDGLRTLAAAGAPPADVLLDARELLVRDDEDTVALLSSWPAAWRGQPLDVRDAPTRRGPVSCSLRWHGERPALLWDAPPGVTVRAPGLDPSWSTTDPRGEALLAPPT